MKLFNKENTTETARAAAILDELRRIDVALVMTERELQNAEADLPAAEVNVGAAAAAIALEEEADLSAAQQSVRTLKELIETVASRRMALEARKRLRRDQLVELEADVLAERGRALGEQTEPLLREMYKLAGSLRRTLLKLQAIGSAAGWNGMQFAVEDCRLRDPDNFEKNLLDVSAVRQLVKNGDNEGVTLVPAYSEDPDAVRLFERATAQFAIYTQCADITRKVVEQRIQADADAVHRRKLGLEETVSQ